MSGTPCANVHTPFALCSLCGGRWKLDKCAEFIYVSLSPSVILKQVPFYSFPDLYKEHVLSHPTPIVFRFYLLPPLQPDEAEMAELSNHQESPHWYARRLRLISLAASVSTVLRTHHFGLSIWLPFQDLSVTPGVGEGS